MAKRYGGKYSPDGSTQTEHENVQANSFDGASPDAAGARANVLFVPPVVLVATTLTDGAIPMAMGLLGAAALVLAAWLLRSGLRAEAEYNARKVARRPAMPRKTLASLMTGLGAALAVMAHAGGIALLAPVIFGIAAAALHFTAFGPDPIKDKGMEGVDKFEQDRVARVVDKAEEHLAAMQDAVLRAGDRQVEARVERFQTKVRQMLRTVEEDPRDLTAARKYLGVYLMGAKDAAVQFADIYARDRNTDARSKFMMLLTDMEESFNAQTQRMMENNHSALDVEIDVLRDRLKREGVRSD